ncbi:MAG: hypothetical protein ACOY93_08605 [Bacillota bacterium]
MVRLIRIVWSDVRAEVPDALWAENAGIGRQHVEVRLRQTAEGYEATARFYAGGLLLETWTNRYRILGAAQNGYQEVRRRAERWLNGFHVRGLRPARWQIDTGRKQT